jgi:hypothetical protein
MRISTIKLEKCVGRRLAEFLIWRHLLEQKQTNSQCYFPTNKTTTTTTNNNNDVLAKQQEEQLAIIVIVSGKAGFIVFVNAIKRFIIESSKDVQAIEIDCVEKEEEEQVLVWWWWWP